MQQENLPTKNGNIYAETHKIHFVGRCHDYKTSFVIWKEKNFMLLFQALLGFPLKLFVPSFKGAFHRVTASG